MHRVASAHPETTRAAGLVLEAGGNAFDAVIAAAWMACVAEPIFASLGGGGHALVRPVGRAPALADFFVHTPRRKRLGELDFYPIVGNFGTDVQEFHVGHAAAATPGLVAGLFALAGRHATLPMTELAAPAVAAARGGVGLNAMQVRALDILEPIVRTSDATARLFGLAGKHAPLPSPGCRVRNPALADCIAMLAATGADAFYRGPVGAAIAGQSRRGGGHLTLADLEGYRVRWRRPMRWDLRGGARLWSNPAPAFGGIMLALMTRELDARLGPGAAFGSAGHLAALFAAMRASQARRIELERPECIRSSRSLMQAFRRLPPAVLRRARGTTHISVRDAAGNIAAMTLTNGEGCGSVVEGCGFMLNNMLGEEDLNRLGFNQWPTHRRLASMMAPTLVHHGDEWLALGSGGSNRIRTALAQVLANRIRFGMSLDAAVAAPRVHLEGRRAAVEGPEPDWPAAARAWMDRHQPRARRWPGRDLYFGGVQAVSDRAAAADPRRQGAVWSGDTRAHQDYD